MGTKKQKTRIIVKLRQIYKRLAYKIYNFIDINTLLVLNKNLRTF